MQEFTLWRVVIHQVFQPILPQRLFRSILKLFVNEMAS